MEKEMVPEKKKRNSYTVEFKCNVLDYLKTHSVRNTAESFSIARRMVKAWRDKEQILRSLLGTDTDTAKKKRKLHPGPMIDIKYGKKYYHNPKKSGPTKAIFFDLYDTLVDTQKSLKNQLLYFFRKRNCKKLASYNWPSILENWQLNIRTEIERINTGDKPFVNLDVIQRQAFHETIETFNVMEMTMDDIEYIVTTWQRMKPWKEAVATINQLRKKYYVVYVGNANMALVLKMSKSLQITWDSLLGAEIVQQYLPHPQIFYRASQLLFLPLVHCVFVTSNHENLRTAHQLGLITIYLHRIEYNKNHSHVINQNKTTHTKKKYFDTTCNPDIYLNSNYINTNNNNNNNNNKISNNIYDHYQHQNHFIDNPVLDVIDEHIRQNEIRQMNIDHTNVSISNDPFTPSIKRTTDEIIEKTRSSTINNNNATNNSDNNTNNNGNNNNNNNNNSDITIHSEVDNDPSNEDQYLYLRNHCNENTLSSVDLNENHCCYLAENNNYFNNQRNHCNEGTHEIIKPLDMGTMHFVRMFAHHIINSLMDISLVLNENKNEIETNYYDTEYDLHVETNKHTLNENKIISSNGTNLHTYNNTATTDNNRNDIPLENTMIPDVLNDHVTLSSDTRHSIGCNDQNPIVTNEDHTEKEKYNSNEHSANDLSPKSIQLATSMAKGNQSSSELWKTIHDNDKCDSYVSV